MTGIGDLRLAIQHLQLQHRACLYSVASLGQTLFSGLNAQFRRLLAQFRRQEAVVKLLHFQRNLVLGPVCIVPRNA